MRNRSYVAPFILIALGALFLINNVVPDLSIWRVLGNWWPVLLIVVGVIRLVEVLVSLQRDRAPVQPVRPMGFGWILAIVLVGAALTLPGHVNRNWHWGPIRAHGVEIFGEEFDFPVTVESPAGAAKRIVLDNLRGKVTVTGGDDATIHVDGHKVIHAFDQGAADTVNGRTRIVFAPEGDALFIRATEPSSTDQSQVTVDLEISIPRRMNVEARGRSGDLTIHSVEGAVDVASQRGEIRLQDIGGNAKLEVEHCDLVRAMNVKGLIDLQGNGRDVQLENVSGAVTIAGRFSGTLDFRNLERPLHFESEQTDLRVEKLPGTINMDLSDLRAENAVGPVRFVTHSRDVHLDEFSGPVSIEVGRGDVDLKPAHGTPLSRIDVRSRKGNIAMALPTGGGFDLKATAQQGEVANDYGDGVVSESQGRTNTMRSASPGGVPVVLSTERGEVSVRKLD